MSQEPTLGQRLRSNMDRMEQARIDRENRANAEKLAAEMARKDAIRAQLETYKRHIENAVCEGLVFKPVKLPASWTLYSNGIRPISHAQHPDNHIWHDFEDWAEANDLHVSCEYEHDGFGEKSWYVLSVKPA